MTRSYYNEFNPRAAKWLRNLISAGLIPPGDVDERSIEDVTPNEIRGYTQCHFFAGVGGWPYALALAGWPADRPVWTGSCPCQPFSSAGEGTGFDDQRHLWPAWFHLIRECRPDAIFGEQVAKAVKFGWLDLVSADLESQGYRIGPAVLGAHSVGAPHNRERLYFVADPGSQRNKGLRQAARLGEMRPWGAFGEVDLLALLDRPFSPGGSCHPQPLLRRMDDGFPRRLDGLHGYGNAIVPQVAAEVIAAYMEAA